MLFPPDFWQKIMASSTAFAVQILQAVGDATLRAATPYLPWFFGLLFLALIIASIKALFGETGMLGSILYHIFFFGILGILVLIWGWGIFFNSYFDLITLVLYRFCYWLVGRILERFKR
jgi:hypothetical protein